MYWTNCNSNTQHLVFVGRWCPLHKGHTFIMKKMYEEKKLPLLILIRDTDYDILTAEERKKIIIKWLEHSQIPGTVIIIPDIEGVYYGRGVGYNVEEIPVPPDVKTISATDIRNRFISGDETWKEYVADGTQEFVANYIKRHINKLEP